MQKSVLITGCTEGSLGHAMARLFSEHGFLVFATVRGDVAKAGSLGSASGQRHQQQHQQQHGGTIEVLLLDVTSKDSIAACAQAVERRTGGTLDVLVNNAAYSQWFPLLDVDLDEARRAFETNFWGMLQMIQTCAPMLIRARGIICNHGSIAGCFPMLWDGIYGSSKAAVEHMTQVLGYELEPLGVRVLCALIGIVDTPMWEKQSQLALPPNSVYRPVQQVIDQVRAADKGVKPTGRNSATPEATARAIIRHILKGRSGLVWVGGMAKRLKWLIKLFPVSMVFRLMNKGRGIDALKGSLVETA